MQKFHLTAVVTSRNDTNKDGISFRLQQFVTGFINQCEKHCLSAELIIVEWNPPENSPFLSEILSIPKEKNFCVIRVIQVPKKVHDEIDNSDKLPLFEMIAKNVGIRHARGRFVLATNIDVLFSDAIITFLRDKLTSGFVYKAGRYDVPSGLPSCNTVDDLLTFCEKNGKWIDIRSTKSENLTTPPFRFAPSHNHFSKLLGLFSPNFTLKGNAYKCFVFMRGFYSSIRELQTSLKSNQISFLRFSLLLIFSGLKMIKVIFSSLVRSFFYTVISIAQRIKILVKTDASQKNHTNACGDFTLMSYSDWQRLKGYPEWPVYSWHLDSILVHQARINNIPTKICSNKQKIYHIEHDTPECNSLLFDRLNKNDIPYINNTKFDRLLDIMKSKNKNNKPHDYNKESWGLPSKDLANYYL